MSIKFSNPGRGGAGGGGASTITAFVVLATTTDLANERLLSGTANQIIITDNGAGSTVVLSLPQNIATGSSPTFSNLVIQLAGDIRPSSDSQTALNIAKADGTDFVTFDTTNSRVGIGTNLPAQALDINGFYNWSGQKRITSQFNISSTTTLTNVTNLSVDLDSNSTYKFEADLFVDASVAGGTKYAINGTATASSIIYEVMLIDDTTSAMTITSRQTSLGGAASQSGTTAGLCKIVGTVTTSSAGSLVVQFSQAAASGTSSALAGSTFIVNNIA